MSWKPLVRHGQSEAEVLAAFRAQYQRMLSEWRRELLDAGTHPGLIELLCDYAERRQDAQFARDLPLVMRDMAISAGQATQH